jgi:hypothetical protein
VTAAPRGAPVFARYGAEATSLPPDIDRREGWSAWAEGHDVRLWHHATDVDEPFSIFARQDEGSIGFHFGTRSAARERHRIMFRMQDPLGRHHGGYMLAVLVRHSRALRLPDKHAWDMDQVTSELVARGLIGEEQEEEILDSCDVQALFGAVEVTGYDAILYPNETEGLHDGSSDSVLVWRACQIKSVHAASFSADDPRLCPSLSPTPEEWQWWEENERGLDEWTQRFTKGLQARKDGGRCRHG